jgi:hypothetical protein
MTPECNRCRTLLGAEGPAVPVDETRAAASLCSFGRDPARCPRCHEGRLIPLAEWRPTRLGFASVRVDRLVAAPNARPLARVP